MAYEIYRVNPDPVVTFAAQELKKYLCHDAPLRKSSEFF